MVGDLPSRGVKTQDEKPEEKSCRLRPKLGRGSAVWYEKKTGGAEAGGKTGTGVICQKLGSPGTTQEME